MDGVQPSPAKPADGPSQRNPPLAPSQELAYRNKCIQLKKRLTEIEANNDKTRRRIGAEKERVQKQRLLRAILLNQLRDIMETPGRKWKPEELEKMGIAVNGDADDVHHRGRPEGEVLLDDSSEDSEEDIPEPGDRPTRTRRSNNNYRGEAVLSANSQPINPNMYEQTMGLPAIAPANSYSPAAAREPLLTSSFQTPVAAAGSPQPYSSHQQQQPFIQDARYTVAHSPPAHATQAQPLHSSSQSRAVSLGHAQPAEPVNGYSRPAPAPLPSQPVRPKPPYNQFVEHMRPQLEADNYPREHIQGRIDEEWDNLSEENRTLWHQRYNDQMVDYQREMDAWNRAKRRPAY